MKKKHKMPLKNFIQGLWLSIVLILVQHDQKIKKPAKTVLHMHFNGFSRFCLTKTFITVSNLIVSI